MPNKRYKAEQIVTLLRQIEVGIANGKTTPQVCKEAEITVQTYYRWRKEYGGLKLDQAKRLKELEKENAKLNGRLDWPDITHGAAGQGLAAYHCAERLHDAPLAAASQRSAAFLVQSQKADGSWQMPPPGVDGMSGETLTGFAHGVSGIVYFLAEYARRTGDNTASKSCQAGIDWLLAQAFPAEDGHALEWRYSDLHRETWKWWCHGSPGIALTFLRLFEHTNDVSYAETAKKALRAHPEDIRYANLSQCHGLAGLGEVYLEAARLFGEPEWYEAHPERCGGALRFAPRN